MKDNKKKIALYGGSFDPPHYGHAFGIWSLINSDFFDEIWIMPSTDRVDKLTATPASLRLKMISILVEENFKANKEVVISNLQIANQDVPKTSYQLLKYLSKNNIDSDFYLAIGAELISELGTWVDSEELCKFANFVIIPRLGINPDVSKLKNYKILNTPKELDFNISSSVVRKLFKDKRSVSGIMPKSIIEFVKSNKLYSDLNDD